MGGGPRPGIAIPRRGVGGEEQGPIPRRRDSKAKKTRTVQDMTQKETAKVSRVYRGLEQYEEQEQETVQDVKG